MTISTLVLIVLVVLLIGGIPAWPYSSGWGYYLIGTIGALLLSLIVLMLLGRA